MLDRELREKVKEYKLQVLQEKKIREALLNSKPNLQALEEFIQKCNQNPGLKVTITLKDGTRYDLVTYKETDKIDPLFTEKAYE